MVGQASRDGIEAIEPLDETRIARWIGLDHHVAQV
jgi:hypothetical protein